LAFLLPPLRVVERLVAPWAALATRVVDRRLPMARVEPTPQESLEDLLREGEVEGVGAAGERAIISGVVEFGTRLVRDAMTPRDEIVGVEQGADAPTVARVVAQSKFSRLPVYRESLDRIEGLLTSWDVIARPEAPLHRLRPVAIAAPDEPCHTVMTRMLRDRRHLAIVQGLAGETVGLVTLEDLIEEVVGDIHDEHDEPQVGER
jgi:putative hemolysin